MSSETSSSGSLRSTAIRGARTLFAASLVAKLAGIATIYVTGAVLSKRDFAIYAIAIAWGEIFGHLQNGGLHRFLLQRARSFDTLYAPVLGMALAINAAWFFMLLVLAPFVADAYKAPEVKIVIILFGLSLPLGTMALLMRAQLLINLKYTEISVLDVLSALIRNGGVIACAIGGLGPLSFVLPVIAVSLFESIYLTRNRPARWRPSLPRPRLFRAILRPLLWILLGAAAMSLVINGDYLVIGALADKTTTGVYFFGFQLTVAILTLFTRSLRSVFVSSFVSIGDDRPRQERALLRSLEMSALVLFFIMFAIATVAGPVVGWVWSGKWDAAVVVIEIIAVASLARVVSPVVRALLEARGAWRAVAVMAWIEGLGLMASAAIGVFAGGLFAIAVSVGAYMTLIGILYMLLLWRSTALSLLAIGKSVLVPYAIAGAALALAWALARTIGPAAGAIPDTIIKGAGFSVSFALLAALLRPDLIRTAVEMVYKRAPS